MCERACVNTGTCVPKEVRKKELWVVLRPPAGVGGTELRSSAGAESAQS